MSIAYQSNNDFCFDIDVLNNAAKAYSDNSERLSALKSDLLEAMEQLKTVGWQSNAGEAFFNNLESNWAADIDTYIELLNLLSGIISDAATTFTAVEEEAQNLKLDTSDF